MGAFRRVYKRAKVTWLQRAAGPNGSPGLALDYHDSQASAIQTACMVARHKFPCRSMVVS